MVLAVATTGCTRTWSGKAVQPNPLSAPLETLRVSEEIVIVTGDMDLLAPDRSGQYTQPIVIAKNRRWPLVNKAQFTLVSRNRLRVHVQLEHKWEEYVDVNNWRSYIVDDKGRRYVPVAIDRADSKHEVIMWDYERRSVVRNIHGDIVHVNDDGHRRRNALGSLSWFRGNGDFVFYGKDLFTEDIKSLTFVLERRGMRFTFTWKFADDAPPPAVATAR